ncbi:hypothetical protein [Streptomonospora salina]|uniref:Uncharacterized protein n=1 Tax=Streptomonospora salina TaxID=104205 RepID=A0A841E712_9ACTN|nr:hypothetical protein [Streptomonospora salina]MBB5999727.1 hypothetical protein [Streptomonospora salina]
MRPSQCARGEATNGSTCGSAGRLDPTVDAVALQPKFTPLFADPKLSKARTRLEKFGHPAAAASG